MSTPLNPYSAPQGFPHGESPHSARPATSLHPYVTVVVIIDILLRVLRFFLAALSTVGVFTLDRNSPLFMSGVAEMVTGLGMAIFGLVGDGLVLAKKRIGIAFCVVAGVATIGNMITGVVQIPVVIKMQKITGGPELIGAYVGAAIVIVIRLGLLAAYVMALVMASKTLSHRENPFSKRT